MKTDRNKKIDILIKTESQDAFGQNIVSYPTKLYSSIWASIEPLTGREYFNNEQLQTALSGRIKIEYMTGITTKHVVLYGSRYFDIISIINYKEQNRELTLMVKELF